MPLLPLRGILPRSRHDYDYYTQGLFLTLNLISSFKFSGEGLPHSSAAGLLRFLFMGYFSEISLKTELPFLLYSLSCFDSLE